LAVAVALTVGSSRSAVRGWRLSLVGVAATERKAGRVLEKVSATNPNHFTRAQAAEGLEDFRHEGTQFLDAVRARHYHNNPQAQFGEILLKLEILIDGQEGVKTLGCSEAQ
jgi:hypothetical protein